MARGTGIACWKAIAVQEAGGAETVVACRRALARQAFNPQRGITVETVLALIAVRLGNIGKAETCCKEVITDVRVSSVWITRTF